MVTLREFIGVALNEIILGVEGAQTDRTIRVPAPKEALTMENMSETLYWRTIDVEFDVAVTFTEADKAGGGVNLQVVKGGVEHTTAAERTNRVKFAVPVSIPTGLFMEHVRKKVLAEAGVSEAK